VLITAWNLSSLKFHDAVYRILIPVLLKEIPDLEFKNKIKI